MVGPPGQSEAVHGNSGDGIVGYFKLDAGVDGPALIFRYGKNGAGNQLLQLTLGDGHRPPAVDIRQLRIILGGFGGDGEGGVACPDGDLVVLPNHHGDRPLRQTADNVAEKLSWQNTLAGVGHIRFDIIGNGGLHIISGKTQSHLCLAENTLDNAEAALLRHGASGDIQACNQHTFFTGKAHGLHPFLCKLS